MSGLSTAEPPAHRTVPGMWWAPGKHFSNAPNTEHCITDQTVLVALAVRRPQAKLVATVWRECGFAG